MLFRDFCEIVEKLGTPKESRKIIRELLEDDPVIVCNFLMGNPIERKLGYSKRTVELALQDYGIILSNYANPGNAAAELNFPTTYYTLLDVYQQYVYLADTSVNKVSNIQVALTKFNDIERKYFINILLNKMQNGIGWGTIKYALADKYNVGVEKVDEIYRRTQSIEDTIEELSGNKKEFDIGTPVMSQLASTCVLEKLNYPLIGEPKLDGFRAQIHVKDGNVNIFSGRNIKSDKTLSFPDIVEKVKSYPNGVYDGEIVGYDNGDLIPFSLFQHRITAEYDLEELIRIYPALFIPFDILHDGEEPTLSFPYLIRKGEVEDRCKPPVHYCMIYSAEEAKDYYEVCINEGYEGIVLKTPYGKYYPGEGKVGKKEWYKYKPAQHTYDCIIIGAKWGTGSRHDVLASFDIAVEDDILHGESGYYNIGNVGNGFTRDMLEYLTDIILNEDGSIPTENEFIEKRIVIEVKTDTFLKNKLRFPRFVAYRDKYEIDKISEIIG